MNDQMYGPPRATRPLPPTRPYAAQPPAAQPDAARSYAGWGHPTQPCPTQPYVPPPRHPGDPPPWPPAGAGGPAAQAGWWGTPPGPPTGPPLPVPGDGRAGVVLAAVLVVLSVVAGILLYGTVTGPITDPVETDAPGPTVAAPAAPVPTPTTTAATEVDVTVTDNLASFQVAESVTVYVAAREVGTLRIDSSSPTDRLTLTLRPGRVDYQLRVDTVLTGEYGGRRLTLTGSGTVDAYEGAQFYVDIVRDSSDTLVPTLASEPTV